MSGNTLRLDRWLWFTRFYKTRTAASEAVQGGHVRVNGESGKSATKVRVGDRIRLVRQQQTWELEVLAIPERRGPATEARACYAESEESAGRRESRLAELKRDRLQLPVTPGKPDKRTRRLLRERHRRG